MTGNVVDFGSFRDARYGPDADCRSADEYGRPLWLFLLSYQMGESSYNVEIWAYDLSDAQARALAMRASIAVDGQIGKRIEG